MSERPLPDGSPRWVADPGIPWRILLTATVPALAPDGALDASLEALARDQGWVTPPPLVVAGDPAGLRRRLATAQPAQVVIGRAGGDLVVSAHHSAVDGLGLLRVVEALGAGPVTSSARGVGDRAPDAGTARTIARRLREAALAPPAGLRLEPAVDSHAGGDVMVEQTRPGSFRTADLVHAATRAVVAREPARHVAIAIGATRDPLPDDPVIRDRSALLRLRDVERLDRAGIEQALRTAPLQTPPTPGAGGPGAALLGRAATTGMRLLSSRLGSTLLVSHLGEVSAPRVRGLAFHPVTAGGTGLSLGAVGHGGRTVVTLRARAAQWNDDGLEQLLEAVISLL
ncbi:hypothetical protein E9934_03040 [Nocardioides caeni]|uniref:Condensation domain-containing protein n=1 Tax=Nocardioides caeni TaxID=574700 RepID=A0A4S8NNV8_9ACTN|nr:hypothetical protein [Nocardioides caeni]THV18600.1 hypothetical protein E9934_03040 [Nocardioides caeni]